MTHLDATVDKSKLKTAPAVAQKRVAGDEAELTRLQQELARSNMKATLFLSVTYFVTFNVISTAYQGIVVARVSS